VVKFLKTYYPEILVFGFILAIMIIDLSPDYTYVNKAADSIGYAYSAKYLYPSFHSSPPLYLLISHLFLWIPYGTDAWRMSLLSALSTMGACVFIYLTIRKLLTNDFKTVYRSKFLPLLGVLIYGTSAIVISQSIVIQTYALVCMFAVGAYYFAISKRWNLMALMLGLGCVVHLLAFFIALIMVLAYKDFRKRWKSWLIMVACLIFYIYLPITNRPPYMWMPDPQMVNSSLPHFIVNIYSFVTDTLSTVGFLIGKLSIWDIPKRIFDIIGLVGVSIGIVTIVPIVYYFWKSKFYTKVLFWLIFTPIFIFMIELDPNTYDYTMVAMPFLAIVACLGLNKFLDNFGHKIKYLGYATLIIIVGFGIYNCNYFDIGRTEDPNMSASKLFYEEFNKIPDGAIFMPVYVANWEAIYQYNRDNNKHIYPICYDVLPSQGYLNQLEKDGVKFIKGTNDNLSVQAMETAQSIVRLNDNVWTTKWTDVSTFGSVVVEANHDESLVAIYDIDLIRETAENPQWHWKPYNPYQILDNSITITDWNYVLLSNNNISRVIFYSALGWGCVVFVSALIKRYKKAKVKG
jgi:hypothetical protein